MISVAIFVAGVVVGVVYEKAILAWKHKVQKAATAAKDALAD